MPRFFSLIFLLAGMLFTLPARAEMPRMELIAGFHRIEAEVAADAQSRAQGLMHRKSMGANQGMLFVFPFAERHCMWMRNTLIPLDMIFIRADGTIDRIAENRPPQDDTPTTSGGIVSAVLELPGGTAARLGLDESGVVRWSPPR